MQNLSLIISTTQQLNHSLQMYRLRKVCSLNLSNTMGFRNNEKTHIIIKLIRLIDIIPINKVLNMPIFNKNEHIMVIYLSKMVLSQIKVLIFCWNIHYMSTKNNNLFICINIFNYKCNRSLNCKK